MLRSSFHTVVLSGLLFSLVFAAWACGGGLQVGSVRARGAGESGVVSVRSLRLDPVASFVSSDSRAPAWSPDSSKLVFTDRYMGRIQVFDLAKESTTSIYESSTSTLPDVMWNIESPVFLDDSHVLSSPGYGPSITADEPWSKLILTNLDGPTHSVFDAQGTRPRVSPDGKHVLLEGYDGMRLIDHTGNEIRTWPNIYDVDWTPDSLGFVAIRRQQAYTANQPGGVVHVLLDGTEKSLGEAGFSPKVAPDQSGVAFVVSQSGSTYFDPWYEHGVLKFYNFETGKARTLARAARQPTFSQDPMFVFYGTPSGLGVSDLETSRIVEGVQITAPNVSPDGRMIVGVEMAQQGGYGGYYAYGSVGIEVFAIGFD